MELRRRMYGGTSDVRDGLLMQIDAKNPLSYSGSGNIWNDLSGLNNHVTLFGGYSYSADNGGAIRFNGVVGTYGQGAVLEPQSYTLSIWFKSIGNGSSADYNVIYSANPQFNSSVVDMFLGQSYRDSSCVLVQESAGGGLGFSPITGATLYNVVFTYDAATATLKAYLNNGSPISNTVVNISYPTSGVRNCQIGRWGYSGIRCWNGNVNAVRLYNRALTQAEINTIYNVDFRS